jgi:hypothetical protein
MLLAAGAVSWEAWLAQRSAATARWLRGLMLMMLGLSLVSSVILMTPISPVNSPLWEVSNSVHDNFREQIGWPDLVQTVADIYHTLPEEERTETGILTGNFGEAGAINLYRGDFDLPRAISPVNTMWLRGYGDPAPQQVIVLGFSLEGAQEFFVDCQVVGEATNRFGVENEETSHPTIYLCLQPRLPWDELWRAMQRFG